CLTASNTFDAVTLLEEGVMDAANPSALGSPAGTVIFDGATLQLSATGTYPEGLELVGNGGGGTHGALEVSPSISVTLASDFLLDADTTINVGTGAGLTMSGAISGNGPLIKSGTGGFTFSGPGNNSYAGGTKVNAGTLTLAKGGNVISVPG